MDQSIVLTGMNFFSESMSKTYILFLNIIVTFIFIAGEIIKIMFRDVKKFFSISVIYHDVSP